MHTILPPIDYASRTRLLPIGSLENTPIMALPADTVGGV